MAQKIINSKKKCCFSISNSLSISTEGKERDEERVKNESSTFRTTKKNFTYDAV